MSRLKMIPGTQDREAMIAEAQFDLHEQNMSWITNNNGIHLQVRRPDRHRPIADLWPTTGKWIIRNESGTDVRRGLGGARALIEALAQEESK